MAKSVYYGNGIVIGRDGDHIIIKLKAPKTTYFGDPASVTLGKFDNQKQRERWLKKGEMK